MLNLNDFKVTVKNCNFTDNIVYNSRFIVKDFSDNFNSLSLRNIDSKTQLSLVKAQLKNKRKMLYFLGASRTGKTYLSIAIVNNFIKNSEGKVAFLNTTMRFQELIDLLFSKNVNDERRRLYYDDIAYLYKTIFIRNGIKSSINNELFTEAINDGKKNNQEQGWFTQSLKSSYLSCPFSVGFV